MRPFDKKLATRLLPVLFLSIIFTTGCAERSLVLPEPELSETSIDNLVETVDEEPPLEPDTVISIIVQPTMENPVLYGADILLEVGVDSSDPVITYQWFKDDLEMPGKTASRLEITDIQEADGAIYFVRIFSGNQIVDSDIVKVEAVDPVLVPTTVGPVVGNGNIVENINGAIMEGGTTGLARTPSNNDFSTLAGVIITACAQYTLGQLAAGRIQLRFRSTSISIGGDSCDNSAQFCGTTPGFGLFTSTDGFNWINHVATPTGLSSQPNFSPLDVAIPSDFRDILVCRLAGSSVRDNIQFQDLQVFREELQ